jgi:hypothetical protein
MKRLSSFLAAACAVALFGCVADNPTEPEPEPEVEVVHYWHFNALPEGTITQPVPSDVSLVSGASISYPGTGAGYMDRTDGSDLNARPAVPAGYSLRVRNPSNTRELIIVAPSTGFENLKVSFAVVRTSSGAQFEEFSYSTNAGATWTMLGSGYEIGLDYSLFEFDLSGIAAASNNPNLRLRILQTGDAAAGSSGNNRFDNIVITGTAVTP